METTMTVKKSTQIAISIILIENFIVMVSHTLQNTHDVQQMPICKVARDDYKRSNV